MKVLTIGWVSTAALASALAAPAQAQSQPANSAQTAAPTGTTDRDDATDDEVVVTGVRASLKKALDIKRRSTQVVDSIVAEDIGKLPDNNVVDALQRVTGIQVTNRSGGETNAVFIRGLPDVLTTLNGRNIFTASGQGFALQDLPATLVGRIDVYKTRAADQIETGLAGQIDVFTRRPFDFKGFAAAVTARGIYNEQSDKINPQLSMLVSDRWETGIGDIGALVNVGYFRNQYRDSSVTAGALVPFATATPPAGTGLTPLQRIFPLATLNSPPQPGLGAWQPGLNAGLPTAPGSTMLVNGITTPYLLSRDAIFASDLHGDRKRPAANVSLQWAPNSSSQYTFDFLWDGYREQTYNDLFFSFVDWWGNLGPNPASTFALYPGTNIIKSRTVGAPFGFMSGDSTKSKTDSFVYGLNGKWDIGDHLKLVADATYQKSTFNTAFLALRTTRVANQITVDFNPGSGVPSWHFDNDALLADPAQWTVGEFYDNGARRTGSAKTFQLDGDYTPEISWIEKLSFGGRYDDRKAAEAARTQGAGALNIPFTQLGANYYFFNSDFTQGRADVPQQWVAPNGYTIANNAVALRQLYNRAFPYIVTGDGVPLFENFRVREKTSSAYAMGDFKVDIAGRPLRVEAGVRFVHVDTGFDFFQQFPASSRSDGVKTSRFLPSVTARYDLTDNFRLRFNYGKTLRRPNFADLNPYLALSPDVTNVGRGSGSGGNPDLKPTRATNYDLTAEWYFAPGSAIYGTAFRREIQGLVVPLRRIQSIPGGVPNNPTTLFLITQPVNASDGVLKGAELGVTLFPRDLPGPLRGLGAQGSLTLLKSSQNVPQTDDAGTIIGQSRTPFFGVSKLSYNVTGVYTRGRFEGRLAYVWRKPFLAYNEAAIFANPIGVYRRAEKSLDAQLSFQATNRLTFTLDATNLTKALSQQYYAFGNAGGPDTDNLSNLYLNRTFAFGLRYSFN